jgi:hypothetical protein
MQSRLKPATVGRVCVEHIGEPEEWTNYTQLGAMVTGVSMIFHGDASTCRYL